MDSLLKKNRRDLKIEVKKTENKGLSLFAKKSINKGELIAYYKAKVFRKNGYESPTNSIYLFEVYKKNEETYKRLIGDIDGDSFPEPKDGIPFWAPLVNEPSKNERINSEIDINTKENYIDRTYLSPGDTIIYKLIATRKIKPGDEILWYYGKDYPRNYQVGKKY